MRDSPFCESLGLGPHVAAFSLPMHLLYLDGSGSSADASQKYYVLGGLSVFERQVHWISQELEVIAARFNPADPFSVELHGAPMMAGRGIWRKVRKQDRIQAIADALNVLVRSHISNRAFVAAIHKVAVSPEDPVEYAFEQVVNRFDLYLMRLHKSGNTQRGVIVFDKSTHEQTLQALARDFRVIGHRWGTIRNLAEVPLFLDSRASRLVQLADLIAYAAFLKFERNNNQFFDIMSHRFDAEGGIVHGLLHYEPR